MNTATRRPRRSFTSAAGARKCGRPTASGGINVARAVSTRRYLAFTVTTFSSACAHYGPPDDCYFYRVMSIDMRTGRRRADSETADFARSLVLVPEGWVAWADGTGVSARINGETRVLDAGPGVDPHLAGRHGATISWTRADGTPGSAELR